MEVANAAEHCLNQIIRFGEMLDGITTPDRSRDVLIAQLSFNLGRYIEIAKVDGRAKWQLLEKCISSGKYAGIVEYTRGENNIASAVAPAIARANL